MTSRQDNTNIRLDINSVIAITLTLFALCSFNSKAFAAETKLAQHVLEQFGPPPSVPSGELNQELKNAVKTVFTDSLADSGWTQDQSIALNVIANSEDPRLAWWISDLMRFAGGGGLSDVLGSAASKLLGIEFPERSYWDRTTDHLMAWNIPAPPNYLDVKGGIFNALVPGWENIFTKGDIDWRHVSWGGVLIDNRAYDTTDESCNCIPAADNPPVTDAESATWLRDDAIVFGIEVNGEYRAYPRRIMEVREMINDTLGGRDLGIPYCTLCGAAQAYFTDDVPEGVKRPVLRTSGLLIRSNKVMYDINTFSVFDTFKGTAVTGDLLLKKVQLKQASVITTEWGKWKAAHPTTTVLAEQLALGRDFDFRNTRDADGPIFPVGDVDPRLGVHEDIVGVINRSGIPVAFQRSEAILDIAKGNTVEFEGVQLIVDAGGLRAVDENGKDMGSHQAFWFAWSQFYNNTKLWPNES